jgi:hypothetical protein
MSVDISKLKRSKVFENEKIIISFWIGEVSNSLYVYIKEKCVKNHFVLLETSPDRYHKSFDKVNEKIRTFVQDKIDEWVKEEEEDERLREESIQKIKKWEENNLRKLIDSF